MGMMAYGYIAILYVKTQDYNHVGILFLPAFLVFLPYNVTAHGLVVIFFLYNYVVHLLLS